MKTNKLIGQLTTIVVLLLLSSSNLTALPSLDQTLVFTAEPDPSYEISTNETLTLTWEIDSNETVSYEIVMSSGNDSQQIVDQGEVGGDSFSLDLIEPAAGTYNISANAFTSTASVWSNTTVVVEGTGGGSLETSEEASLPFSSLMIIVSIATVIIFRKLRGNKIR